MLPFDYKIVVGSGSSRLAGDSGPIHGISREAETGTPRIAYRSSAWSRKISPLTRVSPAEEAAWTSSFRSSYFDQLHVLVAFHHPLSADLSFDSSQAVALYRVSGVESAAGLRPYVAGDGPLNGATLVLFQGAGVRESAFGSNSLAAVPEPSTAFMEAVGILALLCRRRIKA